MDRTALGRKLRRLARLGRQYAEMRARLRRRMAELDVTDGEMDLLTQHADGYVLVLDAREAGSHVTLSDADEISRKRAAEREKRREAEQSLKRKKRKEELERERSARRAHLLEAKKQKLAEMARVFVAAGVNPIDLTGP